jgi:putative peptidoglycan lipid II flippase
VTAPLARKGEMDAPRFVRASPQWTAFWQGFGIMLLGQTLMSFTGIIDQLFAAHLGTGAIATLGYANRILLLPLGLGALAIGRATLPVFSQAQAEGGKQVHRVAAHWVRLMFALGVAALIVGWWLAPWVVRLLFEHGAFTSHDTMIVAEVLRYGLTQLPLYFSGIVLVSLLASQGRHRIIAMVASTNLFVKLAATVMFVPTLGINGLMLATAFMYAVSTLFCWLAVRRTIH